MVYLDCIQKPVEKPPVFEVFTILQQWNYVAEYFTDLWTEKSQNNNDNESNKHQNKSVLNKPLAFIAGRFHIHHLLSTGNFGIL